MAGYADTRQMIIDTLMGRMAGTEIQPEDHQRFALQITDYIRSVELVAGSGVPVEFAEPDTVPVQPDNGQAVYLSYVPRSVTKNFVNFINQSGNSISVTSSSGEVKLVTLLWNGSYWSSQIVTIDVLSDDSSVNASNIGASDYILFSTSSNYSIGDIVRYDGKLYKFTTEHAAGTWNGTDVELASINSILTSKLSELDKRITDTENAVEDIKVIVGSPENTINLISADFSGLVYDGTNFVPSNTSYNSFILPLYAGVTTQIINNTELSFSDAGHGTTFTFSSAPAIGKMEYVRKGSDDFSLLSFEPLDNEKYICINVILSRYSDNNLSFKTGSYGLVKRVDNLESLNTSKGKTILCLGDSITESKDNNGKSYSDYLAEELNAKVINIGVGGANLRQRSSIRVNPENFTSTSQAYLYLDVLPMAQSLATGDWNNAEAAANYIAANSSDDNREIVARAKSVDLQKVDIVTIFAGTNDFSANNLVWGEDDSTNPLSIKGAVNLIVESLLSANPRLKIVFFTPIVRYLNSIAPENWSDVFEVTSEYRPEAVTKNYFLYDIETKIQEACRHNHIPCCAWYWTLGWNKINFMQYFVAPDGTHPKNGYDYIGKKMATFLRSNL